MLADPTRVATGGEVHSSLLPSFCREEAAASMQLPAAIKPLFVFTSYEAKSTVKWGTSAFLSFPIYITKRVVGE